MHLLGVELAVEDMATACWLSHTTLQLNAEQETLVEPQVATASAQISKTQAMLISPRATNCSLRAVLHSPLCHVPKLIAAGLDSQSYESFTTPKSCNGWRQASVYVAKAYNMH